jgi:hypothetical protein
MTAMEMAVAHGYLSATQKGYAEQRERARRQGPVRRSRGDWARDLARDLGQSVVVGSSPDGPMH